MSQKALREELQRKIDELGRHIAADERALEAGDPQARVAAAGDLAALRQRHRQLVERLTALESEHPGGASSELREDMLDLESSFERWARKHSRILPEPRR